MSPSFATLLPVAQKKPRLCCMALVVAVCEVLLSAVSILPALPRLRCRNYRERRFIVHASTIRSSCFLSSGLCACLCDGKEERRENKYT